MDTQNFKKSIFEKVFDLPAVSKEIEKDFSLDEFLENNTSLISNVSPSKVCNYLLQCATTLATKKYPADIIKNVYNAESVKFAILANQKNLIDTPIYKKLAKIFYEILVNSSNYTIMYKASSMKFSRVTKIEPTHPMEFYWLIPLFINTKVLTSINLNNIIEEQINISRAVEDYTEGYEYFVQNVSSFDKSNYKQFVQDGLIEMIRKSKQ